MTKHHPVFLLAICSSAMLDGVSIGADRLVPQQYATIQAAIDASVNGDVVVVSPGTYQGAVNMGSKLIEVRSTAGAESTTIRFSGFPQGAAVTMAGGSLTGFSVTGGRVGISSGSGSIIRRCRIHDNGPPVSQEGSYCGFGIAVHGSTLVQSCVIERNVPGPNNSGNATTSLGGGIWVNGGDVVVEDCVIRANAAHRGAAVHNGGYLSICQGSGGTITLRRCAVYDNLTGNGAAVAGHALASRTVFCGNPCGIITPNTPPCSQGLGSGVVLQDECQVSQTCVDCDTDAVPDVFEILNGAQDINQNWVLDRCECVADLFADGLVNGVDLGIILAFWGPTTSSEGSQRCDFNRDGGVDGIDLGFLLSSWGSCP